MSNVTVVIPNLNGMKYLDGCLNSLREQTYRDFETILIDNGSSDGSADFVKERFPEVRLVRFPRNTGFCRAVNTGIRESRGEYVVLLNNDTVCRPSFLKELVSGMERHPDCFSCCPQMLNMAQPELIDNAGDYYCALGWAFALGKGRKAGRYQRERKVFSCCGGASIYRKAALEKTGLFDEAHFAYLEDIDIGYRARISGYENWYIPGAVVLHAGSASTGSAYNLFKVQHASRNSIYVIYKNMPFGQIVLNSPLLALGFLVKFLFFCRKGLGREYLKGLMRGAASAKRTKKVRFHVKNLRYYIKIQLELWGNLFLRLQAG